MISQSGVRSGVYVGPNSQGIQINKKDKLAEEAVTRTNVDTYVKLSKSEEKSLHFYGGWQKVATVLG